MEYSILNSSDEAKIDAQDLQDLYKAVGWGDEVKYSVPRIQKMLEINIFHVGVYDGVRLIAFGRVLSDGFHAQILDVATHPDYRKQGLAHEVMGYLMRYIRENFDEASLIDGTGIMGFYEKHGFYDAKDEGRFMCWERQIK